MNPYEQSQQQWQHGPAPVATWHNGSTSVSVPPSNATVPALSDNQLEQLRTRLTWSVHQQDSANKTRTQQDLLSCAYRAEQEWINKQEWTNPEIMKLNAAVNRTYDWLKSLSGSGSGNGSGSVDPH